MNDRELLELAAKASGRVITGWNRQHGVDVAVLSDGSYWQPLLKSGITDCDGDALRLAVKLPGLNLQWIIAEAWQAHDDDESRRAYVRRAIVRAAAEIEKLRATTEGRNPPA